MYVQHNIEIRSSDLCCSGKIVGTYSRCVLLALGIQPEMRRRHIFICGLTGSTIFFHIIT